MGKYRKYTAETKVRIVLELLRGDKSVAQASRDYGIKSSLLYRWKDSFLKGRSSQSLMVKQGDRSAGRKRWLSWSAWWGS